MPFLNLMVSYPYFKKGIIKKHKEYPLPLIIDGHIDDMVLKEYHKSKKWLLDTLDENGLLLDDVIYAFFKNKKIYIVKK